jgi:hypothetical protein
MVNSIYSAIEIRYVISEENDSNDQICCDLTDSEYADTIYG